MLPQLRRFGISEEVFDDACREKSWAAVSVDMCKQGNSEAHGAAGIDAACIGESLASACLESHLPDMRLTAHEQMGTRRQAEEAKRTILELAGTNAGPKQVLAGRRAKTTCKKLSRHISQF